MQIAPPCNTVSGHVSRVFGASREHSFHADEETARLESISVEPSSDESSSDQGSDESHTSVIQNHFSVVIHHQDHLTMPHALVYLHLLLAHSSIHILVA